MLQGLTTQVRKKHLLWASYSITAFFRISCIFPDATGTNHNWRQKTGLDAHMSETNMTNPMFLEIEGGTIDLIRVSARAVYIETLLHFLSDLCSVPAKGMAVQHNAEPSKST